MISFHLYSYIMGSIWLPNKTIWSICYQKKKRHLAFNIYWELGFSWKWRKPCKKCCGYENLMYVGWIFINTEVYTHAVSLHLPWISGNFVNMSFGLCDGIWDVWLLIRFLLDHVNSSWKFLKCCGFKVLKILLFCGLGGRELVFSVLSE